MCSSKVDIRQDIKTLVEGIYPADSIESEHVQETVAWIDSGEEIFRIKKPDIPNKHLVSYFCLYDVKREKILLVDHIKAQLWLPSGGHVDINEHPFETAKRECLEELSVEAEFLFENPIFLTSTVTGGLTAGHTDVSLWYLLNGDSAKPLDFDKNEFKTIKWFSLDNIPFDKSDPHMKRFITKLKVLLKGLSV